MYDNPLAIEGTLLNGEPNTGFWEDWAFIAPDDFYQPGAAAYVRLPLATGAVPFLARVQSPWYGIRWDDAAGTNAVITQVQLPGEYDLNNDACVALVTARYSGAGAAVADLALQLTANYFQPGYALGTIATTVTPTLAAGDLVAGEATTQQIAGTGAQQSRELGGFAVGALAGFYTYIFDLSLGVSGKTTSGAADINRFKPLTMLQLSLAPSAAAGATNNIDVLGVTIRIKRSSTLFNRDVRFYAPAAWAKPR